MYPLMRLLPHWGLLLLERICSLGKRILSFLRVTPKLEVIQLAPLEYRIIFFHLSEGMENCKMSRKNQGILR